MFRKPYKVKTSTTMKGSERRTLKGLVENKYPNLSQESVNAVISNKCEMNQVKAMTHAGRTLMIYYSNSIPVFFLLENILYPTVYTLWKHTDLLPTIVTVPPVLEKICNGADLMAPGVIADESTFEEMRNFKHNDVCAIRICGNKAPIAVGVALMSFNELCSDGIKGKAVTIVHNYKDTLWASGNNEDIPIISEPEIENVCDEILELNIVNENNGNSEADNTNSAEAPAADDQHHHEEQKSELVIPPEAPSLYSMDEILYHSFMTAIKVHGSKIQLPMLTSTFYSSYVIKSCPSELNLDIKKTSYKKLSSFLKKMAKDGIIQTKELSKGTESVVAIKLESSLLKSYEMDSVFKNHMEWQKVDKPKKVETTTNIQENYKFPSVVELSVVSAQVKGLFESAGIKKGDSVPSTTIREVVKSYVKNNNLQNEDNAREVTLDPVLCDCVLKKGENRTTMTWQEIFEAIVHNMPHSYQITFEGKEPILKKGKLEPIKITVDTRTGNKKVTLIQNLETYGINPEKVAHHVQIAVAASTSITANPGGKGTLVLIQGNQVLYLQKVFLDTLKVPRKYIQGLENVPSKKK